MSKTSSNNNSNSSEDTNSLHRGTVKLMCVAGTHEKGEMSVRKLAKKHGILAEPDECILADWEPTCRKCDHDAKVQEMAEYEIAADYLEEQLKYVFRPDEKTRITVHGVYFVWRSAPNKHELTQTSFRAFVTDVRFERNDRTRKVKASIEAQLLPHPDIFFRFMSVAPPKQARGKVTELGIPIQERFEDGKSTFFVNIRLPIIDPTFYDRWWECDPWAHSRMYDLGTRCNRYCEEWRDCHEIRETVTWPLKGTTTKKQSSW